MCFSQISDCGSRQVLLHAFRSGRVARASRPWNLGIKRTHLCSRPAKQQCSGSEPARRGDQSRKIFIRTARSTSNPCAPLNNKHRLLTNALAHDSPLVPDARERPPTEHDMREHHTGQSHSELWRYHKTGQIEGRRGARRANLIIKTPRRLAARAGTRFTTPTPSTHTLPTDTALPPIFTCPPAARHGLQSSPLPRRVRVQITI